GPPRTRRRTARCVPASLGPGAVGRAPARVSAEVRMRGAAGALGAGRGDAPRPSGVQGPGAGPDPLPTGAAESGDVGDHEDAGIDAGDERAVRAPVARGAQAGDRGRGDGHRHAPRTGFSVTV